jgi:hypothetical protein
MCRLAYYLLLIILMMWQRHVVDASTKFCCHINNSLLPWQHFFDIEVQFVRSNLTPNRSLGCYALMKPSFIICFVASQLQWPPHCALKAAKHLFKNKSYYHHNANDRFGLKAVFIITLCVLKGYCRHNTNGRLGIKNIGN